MWWFLYIQAWEQPTWASADWRHYKTRRRAMLQSCLTGPHDFFRPAFADMMFFFGSFNSFQPADIKLNLLVAFIWNTPILAVTSLVTACYAKEMEPTTLVSNVGKNSPAPPFNVGVEIRVHRLRSYIQHWTGKRGKFPRQYVHGCRCAACYCCEDQPKQGKYLL